MLQAQIQSKYKDSSQSSYNLMLKKLSSPEYGVNFLDGKIDKKLGDISVLIPTHNRAPYDPKGLNKNQNPLLWCIDSIMDQKGVDIDKIVVVDDASSDYTKELIKSLDNEKILYMKNDKCMGSSVSRNMGIKEIKTKNVQLTDDDCVSAPYSIFCGLSTREELERRGESVGAVRLPIYDRSSYPRSAIKAKQISRLNLKNGEKTDNFIDYPEEYLFNEKFMDDDKKILQPLDADITNAYAIFDRNSYLGAGGFPDFFTWRNNCSEELEIALNMAKKNKKVFFQPDRKAHAVHWKYGSGAGGFSGEDWKKNDKFSLNDMAFECRKKNMKTGNRVSPEDVRHSHIISGIALFRRDSEGLKKYIENSYRDFVHKKDPYNFENFYLGGKTRKEIWESAVKDGLGFLVKMGLKNVVKDVGDDWRSIPLLIEASNHKE